MSLQDKLIEIFSIIFYLNLILYSYCSFFFSAL